MNYRGRNVRVGFIHYHETEPYEIVEGRVIQIHTARGIRDYDTITVIDRNGIEHTAGHTNYFRILEVIN